MITINNKRVHNYIVTKDALVQDGRKISRSIESIDNKIKSYEDKEKRITSKITPPKELTDRGDVLTKEIMKLSDELDVVAKQIHDEKLAAVPEKIKEAHMKLLKEREGMERDRNKIALKVQKIKDRLIPIIQKEVKPLLGEFEDIETAKTKDGMVIIETFDYIEEYKKKLKR